MAHFKFIPRYIFKKNGIRDPPLFYGLMEPNSICFSSLDSRCKLSGQMFVTKSEAFLFQFFFKICISFVEKEAREKLEPFASLSGDESYQSRDLEKVIHWSNVVLWTFSSGKSVFTHPSIECNAQASQQVAKKSYDEKVQPSTLIPKQVGNMYTASLYAAFVSVLHNKHNTLVKLLTFLFMWYTFIILNLSFS